MYFVPGTVYKDINKYRITNLKDWSIKEMKVGFEL